jgi:hypothetical protein
MTSRYNFLFQSISSFEKGYSKKKQLRDLQKKLKKASLRVNKVEKKISFISLRLLRMQETVVLENARKGRFSLILSKVRVYPLRRAEYMDKISTNFNQSNLRYYPKLVFKDFFIDNSVTSSSLFL